MAEVPGGEVLVYEAADGAIRVDVRLEQATVWLTQPQMAEVFGRERSVITKHLRNVFEEGELDRGSNVQILHIAGSDKPVAFYNLDVIISVGYRVKSLRDALLPKLISGDLRVNDAEKFIGRAA